MIIIMIIILIAIIIVTIIMVIITIDDINNSNNYNNINDNNKSPFLKPLAPSPLKVILWHCNTTQMFSFAGTFAKILFSHFLFYFEPKSN